MRICTTCGFKGEDEQFEPGRRHRCLTCRKKYNDEYYVRTADKRRQIGRDWHKDNRERSRANATSWKERNRERYLAGLKRRGLVRHYGITLEQRDAMIAEQGGCAICRCKQPIGKDWCVDHNHRTGRVRAILCSPCNQAIGLFKESAERMERAVLYIEGHDAIDYNHTYEEIYLEAF